MISKTVDTNPLTMPSADVDRACAREMGWEYVPRVMGDLHYYNRDGGFLMYAYKWSPTSNPAQAIEFAEAMQEAGKISRYEIHSPAPGRIFVQIVMPGRMETINHRGATFPDALSRAVLAAVTGGGE